VHVYISAGVCCLEVVTHLESMVNRGCDTYFTIPLLCLINVENHVERSENQTHAPSFSIFFVATPAWDKVGSVDVEIHPLSNILEIQQLHCSINTTDAAGYRGETDLLQVCLAHLPLSPFLAPLWLKTVRVWNVLFLQPGSYLTFGELNSS